MTKTLTKSKSDPKKAHKSTQRTLKRKQWFKSHNKSRFKKKAQLTLEDLSEEDFASGDDISDDDEEYGTLTDTSDESSEEEVPLPEGIVSSDSENETLQKSKKSEAPTEEDSRTIFVGNLPNKVKRTRLRKLFSKYGEVEAVRLRCPPRADPFTPKKVATIKKEFHDERTNILAFVRFTKIDGAVNALQANGLAFDNMHHLRVDLSVKPASYDAKKSIFIGNLPFNAEEDQLRNIFSECGDIEGIRIIRDKVTCVGKGFAYVNFKERKSVSLAMELDGEELGKRKLRVQKVNYKAKTGDKPNTKYKKDNFSFKKENPNADKFERKKFFQGEMGKRREKRKTFRKKKLEKKKEVFKKILNNKSNKKSK